MKALLIAAGMAASLFMAAPSVAAPVAGTGVGAAPQEWRGDRRADRRDERRMDRRDARRWDRRGDRRGNRWDNRGRRYGWGRPHCQNVRRHHRWVRVCTR